MKKMAVQEELVGNRGWLEDQRLPEGPRCGLKPSNLSLVTPFLINTRWVTHTKNARKISVLNWHLSVTQHVVLRFLPLLLKEIVFFINS